MSYNLSSTSPIYHYIHSSPSNPSKCTPNLSIILNRIRLHNSPRPGLSTIHLRLTLRQLAPALAISNFPSILFHRKPQSYKHKLFLPISPGPRPSIHRILSHTGLLPIHPLSPPPRPLQQSWGITTTIPPFTARYPPPSASYTPQQPVGEYAGDAVSPDRPRGENNSWTRSSPRSLASSPLPSVSSQSRYAAGSRSSAPHQVGNRAPRRDRSSTSRSSTQSSIYKLARSQVPGLTHPSVPSSSMYQQEPAVLAENSAEAAAAAALEKKSDELMWRCMREYHGELLIYYFFCKYDNAAIETIWNIALDRYKVYQERAAAAGLPGTRFFRPSCPR